MDPTAVTQIQEQAQEPDTRRPTSPWANRKLVVGAGMVVGVLVLTLIGRLFWDTTLARAAAHSPIHSAPRTAAATCWRC
jgi:peptide/nickel transport system permease protein